MVAQTVKRLSATQESRVRSLDWEEPLEKEMATHSSILPGKSHGQRSLVGDSVHRKESDMIERLHFHFLQFGEPSPTVVSEGVMRFQRETAPRSKECKLTPGAGKANVSPKESSRKEQGPADTCGPPDLYRVKNKKFLLF